MFLENGNSSIQAEGGELIHLKLASNSTFFQKDFKYAKFVTYLVQCLNF